MGVRDDKEAIFGVEKEGGKEEGSNEEEREEGKEGPNPVHGNEESRKEESVEEEGNQKEGREEKGSEEEAVELTEARKVLDYYSGKASDLIRQFGFAGIAIIWLFRSTAETGPRIPAEWTWPALLVGTGLALDLLHYSTAALVWRLYYRHLEGVDEHERHEGFHPRINLPSEILFWLKTIVMVAAYVLIARNLVTLLSL